jgi:hypothetical protein
VHVEGVDGAAADGSGDGDEVAAQVVVGVADLAPKRVHTQPPAGRYRCRVAADPDEQQVVVDVAGAEDGGLRMRPGDDRPAEDGPYPGLQQADSSAYHDAYAYHDAAVDGPTQLSRLVGLPDGGAPRALAP